MNETIITVQGTFSLHRAPERARIGLTVSVDGEDRDTVFSSATTAAAALADRIGRDFDPVSGPIHARSSDSVRVWAERPFVQDGSLPAPVHHASIGFTAQFGDFDALSRFIDDVAAIDGVMVDDIAWTLTDATLASLLAEVRSRAVKDAVAKASIYAQSIGLASVRAVALADAGMLSETSPPSPAPHLMRMAASTGDRLSLRPENIDITAVVDARFVAT